MSTTANGGQYWRNSPLDRGSPSPSPSIGGPIVTNSRPKSMFTSPQGAANSLGHNRNHSFSPLSPPSLAPFNATRTRSSSNRTTNQSSNTFAPQFIKTEELQQARDEVGGIEGENDFSGKRYVWLRDPQLAFVKGWIVEESDDNRLEVQCDDGSVRGPVLV